MARTGAKKIFFSPRGRIRLWVWLAALLPALYFIGLGAILPRLARPWLEGRLAGATNAGCSIAGLAFNPLDLTVSASGLELRYPDGSKFLRVEEIRIRPGRELLWLTPSVNSLEIIKPSLRLGVDKHGVPFLQSLEPAGESAAPEQPRPAQQVQQASQTGQTGQGTAPQEKNSLALNFILRDLVIKDGDMEFYDGVNNKTHRLADFQLHLPFASTLGEDREKILEPSLTCRFNDQPLVIKGQSLPFSDLTRTEFELTLTELPLKDFRFYFSELINLDLLKGALSANVKFGLDRARSSAEAEKLELWLSGDFTLTDILLSQPLPKNPESGRYDPQYMYFWLGGTLAKDPSNSKTGMAIFNNEDGQKLSALMELSTLSIKKAALHMERLTPFGASGVNMERISVDAPYLNLVRDKDGKLPLELFVEAETPEEETEKPDAQRPFFMKNIDIRNGSLNFKDHSLPGGYETRLENISCYLAQVLVNGNHANNRQAPSLSFLLNAALPEGGTLEANGQAFIDGQTSPDKTPARAMTPGKPLPEKLLPEKLLPEKLLFDMTLDLQNAALELANPYLQHLAGFSAGPGQIARLKGRFSLREKPIQPAQTAQTATARTVQARPGGASGKNADNNTAALEITLNDGLLALNGLRLLSGKTAGPVLKKAELDGVELTCSLQPQQMSVDLKIGGLQLQGPEINLRRKGQGFEVTGLPITPGPGGQTAQAKQTGQNVFNYQIGKILVEDGRLELRPEGSGPALSLHKAALKLEGLSSGLDEELKLELQAQTSFKASAGATADDGSVKLDARGKIKNLNVTAQAGMERLPLPALLSLLPPLPYDISLNNASLGGDLALNLRDPQGTYAQTGGLPEISASGDLRLAGLSLSHKGQEFTGWGMAKLNGLNYSSASGRLRLEALEVTRPRLNIALLADGRLNLAAIFSPDGASGQPGEAAAQGPLTAFHIGTLSITDGQLAFADRRPDTPFEIGLSQLNAKLEPLDSHSGKTAFSLGGVLDSAPFELSGSCGPLPFLRPQPLDLDISINLDGLDLNPLSPYSLKYIGYPVLKGKLYLQSRARIENEYLKASNAVRLARIELGEQVKGPGVPDLPLKFAVSTLKDAAQGVSLSLPVEGRLDDPKFESGGLAGRVVGNLALSIVSTPFTLIGAIFTPSGERVALDAISFRSGSDFVDEAAGDTLRAALITLYGREKLVLNLTGTASAAEADALAEQAVLQAMKELKYQRLSREERRAATAETQEVGPEKNAQEYDALLKEIYKQRTGAANPPGREEMLAALRVSFKPQNGDLKALATRRARKARDFILALDPALAPRIELGEVAVYAAEPGQEKQGGEVRLDATSK